MKKRSFFYLALVIISVLYLFLRLWNLNNLITFQLDQGLHLSEAYQMVLDQKIKLVGPMIGSKVFEGRGFFIGPLYTYSLALLGVLFFWNPLSITISLIIFEYSFLLLFLIWLSKKHSIKPILGLFLLTATCPFLIEHSRFFWNPHFLFPLSFLLIYFLEEKKYFLSAITWGLAFSFHYSSVLWGIPIIFYLFKNHEKFKKYLVFIPGFFIGNLPWFLFELKHNFYNIKTMFLVFTNTSKAVELSSHHFVFPFFAFFIFLMIHIYKKSKKVFYIIFSLVIIFNIFYKFKLQEKIPIGMPVGLTYPIQKQIEQNIVKNGCPNDFNIASTLAGDTQAHDLRYLLTINKCKPDTVDSYPKNKILFLIAPPDRSPQLETVWEVDSFKPFNVTETVKINNYIYFYRLDKSNINP